MIPVDDVEHIKAILNRAIEILEKDGLQGDMWGYTAIRQAAEELGYVFNQHYIAANLFIKSCNSVEIKIEAIKKAVREL